ncbi:MAG: alpha/beta fold hydrolase [Bdellovibrionota bacterium]
MTNIDPQLEVRSGFLPVGVDHQLYFEDIGDITLEPLLFLHGGPGLGCEEKHRTQFDLKKYRVILLNQRGSGRSQTQGELNDNSTQLIVKDIETLRKRLKLEKFSLIGSSWGAVPATLYAAENPDRINTLLLKSPFLARRKDFLWGYSSQGVAQQLQWDWEQFSLKGRFQGSTLVQQYYSALVHAEAPKKERAAWACRWINWEGAQYFYNRPHEKIDLTPETITPYWMNVARIQIHYAKNNYFLDETGIMPSLEKLAATNIKGFCLQGGKDIITPASELEEVKAIWPSLEIKILPEADHKIPEEELLKL